MTMMGDQLRESAARHEQEAYDSFERCDTDGFLSQWAHGINAQKDRMAAEVADAGGLWTFARTRLVTLAGEATDAREVKTRYGYRWRLDSTNEWLPVRPARESTLAKRGYREVEQVEVAPAKVTLDGVGRGLSGTCWVRVYRPDARKSDGWRAVGPPGCDTTPMGVYAD
jgi:hypothetical protein